MGIKQEDIVAMHVAAREALLARARDPSNLDPTDPNYLMPMPPIYGGPDDGSPGTPGGTPGSVFVRSPAFKEWQSRFPSGGPPVAMNTQSDPVAVGGLRALVTSSDSVAGSLVQPDFAGLLGPGLTRPLTLRQLVTVQGTSSDTVDFVREVSRVSGAAPVAEATGMQAAASGAGVTSNAAQVGIGGLKPEGGLVFEAAQALVRTFALWTPATRRSLSDATGLRQYIDTYLTADLNTELEDQMLSGAGTGENFEGILNNPDIGTAGPPGAGTSFIYSIRNALTQVRVDGRTQPNAIVLHPSNSEVLDLLEVASEENHLLSNPFTAGPRSLWSVPIVESTAISAGTALVGDFKRAVLFDREAVNISLGTVMDDFIRNIVRVLGEMRAAFAVIRPSAFVAVDLVA